MQPSRRAFLFGRGASRRLSESAPARPADAAPAPAPAPALAPEPHDGGGGWPAFCHRLRQGSVGLLEEEAAVAGVPQARLRPVMPEDVRHALALCAEYGVTPALVGAEATGARLPAGRAVLWVDPVKLVRLDSVSGRGTRWRAEPGVKLGELVAVGVRQFAAMPPDMTLAAWLADARCATWPPGRGDLTGLSTIDVVLADGTTETLGAFGVTAKRPLQAPAAQRLVSALFQLTATPDGQWCRAQPEWPARYRLDALTPEPPIEVNLAPLFAGHGGTLAWVESVLLLALPEPLPPPRAALPSRAVAAQAVDIAVKALCDPGDFFCAYPEE
jgi:hypothetical protein